MAANPDPTHIPDALWWFWEQCKVVIPGVQLGGIYAPKEGYHSSVDQNQVNWPWSYSIQLPLDLNGVQNKSRAVDLTMGPEEMIKRTKLLKAAADHPQDNRLKPLREFIGTVDGVNVFCYIRNTDSGAWTFDGGRDPSHLWHQHLSWWATYCTNMTGAQSVYSVISGESWEEWNDMSNTRIRISSSDPAYNNSIWLTDGVTSRRVRDPGEIVKGVTLVFPNEIVLNDTNRRKSDGTLRPWKDYLGGVLGLDVDDRATNLTARFDNLDAAVAAIPGGMSPVFNVNLTGTATPENDTP